MTLRAMDDFRLDDFLPYRLAVLSERISRRLAVEYGRMHGLSVAEWRVLVHLQRGGPVSVGAIRDRVNLEKSRVSRAVDRLEAAGLVRKAPGEGDGRLVAISLTAEGRAALADILPAATALERRLLDALRPEERAVLATIEDRLHAVLDADPEARKRPQLDE
jgi:DNA-binding MarR family transcriptional regulator